MSDPIPPHSIETEQAVLGCMLISAKAAQSLAAELTPADFHHASHAALFATAAELVRHKQPLDLLTLPEGMGATALRQMGGREYIDTLVESVPTAAHHAHYSEILRGYTAQRQVIDACESLLARARSADRESLPGIVRATAADLASAISRADGAFRAKAYEHLLDTMAGMIEQVTSEEPGVYFGLPTLDRIVQGLRPKQLAIIAARPSIGKTDFCLSVALHASKKRPVLFLSLEMSSQEILARCAANISGIPYETTRGGFASEADFIAFVNACDRLRKEHQLDIVDTDLLPNASLDSVISAITQFGKSAPNGFVIIDQAQAIARPRNSPSLNDWFTQVAHSSKGVARSAKLPVALMWQLNREAAKRSDHRPQMQDLREAGAAEEQADIIMMLHRQSYYVERDASDPEPMPSASEVIIRKNRNGRRNLTVHCWADLSCTRWYEEDTRHSDPPPQNWQTSFRDVP